MTDTTTLPPLPELPTPMYSVAPKLGMRPVPTYTAEQMHAYARAAIAQSAQAPAQPAQPDDEAVICPACAHQFRAIPVQVQRLLLASGHEPPFLAGPAPAQPAPSVEAVMAPDELVAFEETVEQFGDDGETTTDYAVLMDWARRGFLECTHFEVTTAGNEALARGAR